jgi:lipopolysaccharide transport system permease protein
MLFLLVYGIVAYHNQHVRPDLRLFMVPLLVLQMGILGLGVGMLVSSLVTKYRDLSLLLQFGVQLWMYACPIIYPASQIPGGIPKSLYA